MNEVKEENVVVPNKKKKGLVAVLLVVITIILLGIGITLFLVLRGDSIKGKDKNTYEINSELKYMDIVDLDKNTKLENPNELVDTSTLGEKEVEVTYIRGNSKETIKVKINIVDTTKPVIECEDKIELYAGSEVDINELGTITDNSKEEIKPEFSGEYDLNKEGEYKVTIIAKDSSGNEASKEITLVIKKVELNNEGYYVYKATDEWDEFVFRADGTGSYVPWFCPGSGCGGYGEDGTYKIEGNKIILTTTTASNEGEISNVNNTYEFRYVSKEEIIWIIKDKEYSMKWQKEYDQ